MTIDELLEETPAITASLEARAALWKNTRIRGTKKLVALAISQLAGNDGWAEVKQADLAEFATCSVQALREAIHALEQMGIVEVHSEGGGRGHFCAYRLTIPGITWGEPPACEATTGDLPDESEGPLGSLDTNEVGGSAPAGKRTADPPSHSEARP